MSKANLTQADLDRLWTAFRDSCLDIVQKEMPSAVFVIRAAVDSRRSEIMEHLLNNRGKDASAVVRAIITEAAVNHLAATGGKHG